MKASSKIRRAMRRNETRVINHARAYGEVGRHLGSKPWRNAIFRLADSGVLIWSSIKGAFVLRHPERP